ncbi:MAG: class I SAM-dependent methyltransferase [Candidatus Hydrogenedentes bacterium]|nr:class I SAM-dependent methyltransferase [Candidatus Hydrogenedentota bacterium]
MKLDLLDIVQCPNCAGALRAGDARVCCAQCGTRYDYRGGILDLHPAPSQAAQLEMQGHVILENQWIESIPETLRPFVRDAGGEELLLSLPRLTHPDLVQIPSLARINENASDFFSLLDLIRIRPGEVILEIGAHMGWASHQLARRGAAVLAMDISHQLALTDIFIRRGVALERVFADMMVFPVREGVLDRVFAVATIHHADDLERLFRACARALRPGGSCVFFSEPVAGLYDTSIKEAFGAEEKDLGIQEHIYTIVEYFGAARRAGLRPSVVPLPEILLQPHRRYRLFRKLWWWLLRCGLGYTPVFTRVIYPFMLRYYPRVPFPHLALVLHK